MCAANWLLIYVYILRKIDYDNKAKQQKYNKKHYIYIKDTYFD